MAKQLNIDVSCLKNWLDKGSMPTWKSLVDICCRLNTPPSQMAGPGRVLTDPAFWRQLPRKTLDQSHSPPTKEKLDEVRLVVERVLAQVVNAGELATSAKDVQRQAGVSQGVLTRYFPSERNHLLDRRKKSRALLAAARIKDSTDRLASAAEKLAERGKSVTDRNLKSTGLVKVSDLIHSQERSAQP